ncbi:MAG: glycosyltransferase family 4 protein [Planctomycetota bacterium]
MKILHIYSDWKWTGPSEPILNLCLGLKKNGHDVRLACLPAPSSYSPKKRVLPGIAKSQGIDPFIIKPNRFTQIITLWQNTRRLSYYLKRNKIDIIHAHSIFDHRLASNLLNYIPFRPKIVRTNHTGYVLTPSLRNKSLLSNATDAYITLSEGLRQKDVKYFAMYKATITPDKTWAVGGAIDIAPFMNTRQPNQELKTRYGIEPDDVVVGIIARVQRHRRFHILLWALARAVKEVPGLKLLVLGRGTYYRDILVKPIKKLSVGSNVILSGYHIDDYYDMISLMDFGVYLVPGSDGSCRAVLELMFAGKPMIVARRGVLPDIVDENQNGLVVDDRPDNLSDALVAMARDKEKRILFGNNARTKVIRDFTIEKQVRKVEEIYERIMR